MTYAASCFRQIESHYVSIILGLHLRRSWPHAWKYHICKQGEIDHCRVSTTDEVDCVEWDKRRHCSSDGELHNGAESTDASDGGTTQSRGKGVPNRVSLAQETRASWDTILKQKILVYKWWQSQVGVWIWLTPRNKVLLEKLTVAQLAKLIRSHKP
jgi:hypothetical protein